MPTRTVSIKNWVDSFLCIAFAERRFFWAREPLQFIHIAAVYGIYAGDYIQRPALHTGMHAWLQKHQCLRSMATGAGLVCSMP